MIQPISLQEEIELQLQRGAADTEVPIGSVAAATKNYHLVLYNTGQAAISQPTGERLNFGDITEAVLTIVEICDAICGEDGLIDSSGKELERILDTLVGQGKSLH